MVEIRVQGRKVREYTPTATGPAPTVAAARKRRDRALAAGAAPPPQVVPETPEEVAVAFQEDLAQVVVTKTLRRMADGELKPSLRDGLIAQQLLDRREEKAADRSFMLSLAHALAGGGYEPPQTLLPSAVPPPEDTIEGYFEEIPLAPEHLRAD